MPVYDYSSSANPGRPFPTLGHRPPAQQQRERVVPARQTARVHKLANGDSKLSWDISYTHPTRSTTRRTPVPTSTTFLIDPNNPSLSEGPSDNDIKHRFVGDLTYRLPWGFELSAIASWHSGFPYTNSIAFTCSGCTANSLTGQAQTSSAANFTPVFVDGNGHVIDITQATE